MPLGYIYLRLLLGLSIITFSGQWLWYDYNMVVDILTVFMFCDISFKLVRLALNNECSVKYYTLQLQVYRLVYL